MNSTLEKGLEALECLANRAEPMGLAEIVDELGGSKSTVYRVLETLREKGYIEQERRKGAYRAGLKVLELSSSILLKMELRKRGGPYVHRLAEKTGCDAYLAAESGGRAIMVMVLYPKGRQNGGTAGLGLASSFCYTAIGKLLAAHLPEETLDNLLAEAVLEARTPHTITDKEKLRKEYEKIREHSFAESRYENSKDIYGIAVPVRNFEGAVVAALGLAVPRRKAEKKGMDLFSAELRRAGEELSFALGYFLADISGRGK